MKTPPPTLWGIHAGQTGDADHLFMTHNVIALGFSRIGLANGHQLVDLLVEHWPDIPEDFKNKLALKPGLVRA